MINITYSRRAFNKKGKHDIKKVIVLPTTNFTKYLERAKEFNKNFSNRLSKKFYKVFTSRDGTDL